MRAAPPIVVALLLGCGSFRAEPLTHARDAAPDRADATLDAAPDAPDAAPDAAPDVAPDVAPDATPDVPAPVDAGPCGGSCPAGRMCCNDVCVDLTSDPQNCGGCASSCAAANASAMCVGGRCTPLCFPGFGDCDNSPFNGCEVSLLGSVFNCGACNRTCSMDHASPRCDTGRCVVTCEPGWSNCNGDPADGCEVNVLTSLDNCGGCGTACFAPNHNNVRCEGGQCRYTACEAGFDDCNRDNADGCEADLRGDAERCGACGTRCPPTGGRTPACLAGTCGTTATCVAPRADCDGAAANGCEVDLTTSPLHCGRCGGACGTRNATATCDAGRCGLRCDANFADCDGVNGDGCEVDLRGSAQHCGRCGNACALPNTAVQQCVAGACAVGACAAGRGNCDAMAANGCETDTQASVDHCGGCGRPCRIANGAGRCDMGTCRVAACTAPFADCNNNPADGCETNLSTDPRSCGRCGARCEPPNAVGVCTAGACRVQSCAGNFGDCNGNPADGCETFLITQANCGMCGRACPVGRPCTGTSCL